MRSSSHIAELLLVIVFKFSPLIGLALFVKRPEKLYLGAMVVLVYLNALVDMLPRAIVELRRLKELDHEPRLMDVMSFVVLGTFTILVFLMLLPLWGGW